MFYSTNHRLNRKLRCWITASIFWLSSCHIAGAKSQYRRFISRQKTYNWNSNQNVEVQIQEIQRKPGRYYQIGRTIWKPGGTIWSLVQLAPHDYLGWPGTVDPWTWFHFILFHIINNLIQSQEKVINISLDFISHQHFIKFIS